MASASDGPGRERNLVDDEVHDSLTDYITKALQAATPDLDPKGWVSGGAREEDRFKRRPRNYENLRKYEAAYIAGGPIADFIDSRALMTYGTGVEFQTAATVTDDQGRTVDEWLDAAFGESLDYVMVQIGVQSYWSGNAWVEKVPTRGGEFGRLNPLDPTTIDPEWDRYGRLTGINQYIIEDGQADVQPLDPERVAVFSFRDTPGGPAEVGLMEQNWDEIMMFAGNLEQRANAIKLHGSPKYDVSVGSEGQSIPDKIIRLIRNRFRPERINEKTAWVHGGQIDIETLESPGFEGMSNIVETDARVLSQGFGVPLEWTNFGKDGLGSGAPAESRQTKFERQARGEQGLRSAQFMEQVVRPMLEEFSPFPATIDLTLVFGDVVTDQQAVAEAYRDFAWAYHRDELREKLDDQPWNDTDDRDAPPELDPKAEGGGGGMDGLFAGREVDAEEVIRRAREGKLSDGGGGDRSFRRALFADSVSGEAAGIVQEELVWANLYDEVLWAEDGDGRQLFEFDPEEVPEFVVARLEEAVEQGALFSDFATIPDWAANEVGDVLLDSLEKEHGWSINSLSENLQSMALGLSEDEAEAIARTETQALVADAREQGYAEEFDLEEEEFRWVGPDDHRNTDACEWIKAQVAEEGGAVSLARLKELVEEAPEHDPDINTEPREWTPHINCRHTFVRAV